MQQQIGQLDIATVIALITPIALGIIGAFVWISKVSITVGAMKRQQEVNTADINETQKSTEEIIRILSEIKGQVGILVQDRNKGEQT